MDSIAYHIIHHVIHHTISYTTHHHTIIPLRSRDGSSDVVVVMIVVVVVGTWLLLSSVSLLLTTHLLYPDTLHHPDNYCFVDRYVTPAHIVPEWYFLPFYAMLRSCASKALGVLLLVVSICVYVLNTMVSVTGRHNLSSVHSMEVLMLVILYKLLHYYMLLALLSFVSSVLCSGIQRGDGASHGYSLPLNMPQYLVRETGVLHGLVGSWVDGAHTFSY